MPAISETLSGLNDSGCLSAKQLAATLRVHTGTAYRYLSGETEPTWDQVCSIFQHCPMHCPGASGRMVQSRLLNSLTEGTGWVSESIDADRDINGDGAVNTADIFDGALKVNRKLAELLSESHKEQKHDLRTIDEVRATQLHCTINLMIRHLLEVRQVVSYLSRPRAHARRQA